MPDEATVAAWRRAYAAGATTRQIAAEAGVDASTVQRAVRDISRRSGPPKHPVTARQVVDAYAQYGTQAATAEAMGVSRMVVRARLAEAGEASDPHPERARQ